MHATTKQVDAYTLEAHITIEAPELESYAAKAREHLVGEVTVEGFRKGKAPRHLAEGKLNPQLIKEAAFEEALSESFTQAAKEHAWDIARTSDLKVVKNDATGVEYTVVVHLWPKIQIPDLATIKVPQKPLEVSEQEMIQALDAVRNMRATFLDKTGAAAEGDRVEVDFDSSMGGVVIEGGSSRNHPLIIGGKSFMAGFEEELIGLVPGMSKSFSLTAPADYYEPKLAGKKIDFTVTLHRVQAVLKPEADDAFAQSLGKFSTLEELKASVKMGIMNEKKGKEQQRLRLAIFDAIIAAGDVPTSDAMVKDELDGMIGRFSQDLHAKGIELPMYLARMNKTEDALRSEWRPEAERQVKIMLVLREVARQNSIAVTSAEVETAVNEAVAELIKTGQVTEQQIDPERIRNALHERILRDKIFAFVENVCAEAAV
jgi:trigger factor